MPTGQRRPGARADPDGAAAIESGARQGAASGNGPTRGTSPSLRAQAGRLSSGAGPARGRGGMWRAGPTPKKFGVQARGREEEPVERQCIVGGWVVPAPAGRCSGEHVPSDPGGRPGDLRRVPSAAGAARPKGRANLRANGTPRSSGRGGRRPRLDPRGRGRGRGRWYRRGVRAPRGKRGRARSARASRGRRPGSWSPGNTGAGVPTGVVSLAIRQTRGAFRQLNSSSLSGLRPGGQATRR